MAGRRVLSAALVAVLAAPARGAAPPIEVRVDNCAGVDGREVQRLLVIELAFAADRRPTAEPLQVTLTCAGPRLIMTARDPILGRPLARELTLGPPEPGRDRTIALLASQLFLASWAEGFLAGPAPRPAQETAVAPRVTPPERWDLTVAGGLRLRDWTAPALDTVVAVRPSRRLGSLRAVGELAFETGSAARAGGTVGWWIGAAGLGLGARWRRASRLAFEAAVLVSLAIVGARGEASAPAGAGGSAHGIVGQAALGGGPRLRAGPVRIGLDVQLGGTFPTATAEVAGDRPVALAGVWAGVGLSLTAPGDRP